MGQNSVIIDIICFIYQLRLLVSVGCSVRDGVSLELMFLLLVFVKVGSKMRFLCEEEVELGRKLAEKVSEWFAVHLCGFAAVNSLCLVRKSSCCICRYQSLAVRFSGH
jgi:hypothetical protein